MGILETLCDNFLPNNVSAILYLFNSETYGRSTASVQYFFQMAGVLGIPVIAWNADNSGLGRVRRPPSGHTASTCLPPSPMSTTAHPVIARRDLPGYHPRKWCAVCGKATLKTPYVSCEGENCLNLCHTSCLNGTPVYKCDYTEQLRAQANITDPVTLVSEEEDTPSQQLRLVAQESEERIYREGLEGAQLISLVEKLTEEDSRSNAIIRSIEEDRELIIQNREVFASALRLADRLKASKQRQAEIKTCSQAVSAFSETIDEHWEEVCQGSDS
ncbi:hypothetical protein GWK47_029225 [Chionoecetes opilio]|uniref:Uncharacterized protein n=1 Tax=Chionoecetes opilio TaxID=41210 RepID=A0A8J4YLL5_CHIOP|nr:hypothetical protein GWK47_029225 [Chionoecetes opilio]